MDDRECGDGRLRHVADMFADLGRQLEAPDAPAAFDVVASVAARQVNGARAASVTLLRQGRFETVGSTDERATRADLIQYELGSGPCVDAILENSVFHPQDLRQEARWPEYGARVSGELGWLSMISYRLSSEITGEDVLAGLNLYSDRAHAFDASSVEVGLLLATHAAAVVAARTNQQRADNLEKALRTSRQIGIAIGVLMGTHKLTREQAFDLLRIASQNSNRKLHDLAVEVGETGTLPYPPSSH
jgi:hypothetical protein